MKHSTAGRNLFKSEEYHLTLPANALQSPPQWEPPNVIAPWVTASNLVYNSKTMSPQRQ